MVVVVVTTLVGTRHGSFVEGAEVVWRDGDLVVHAKGSASAAGSTAAGGYEIYRDATWLADYTVRLLDSSDIEQFRPVVEAAIATIDLEVGPRVRLAPGLTADDAGRGEIDIQVSSRSPCLGRWLGCTSPVIVDGELESARIWLSPRLLTKSAAVIDNTVRHEIGHALGLAHYDATYDGRDQVMHSRSFGATEYETGDIAGFRRLAGVRGRPAPPPAPDPALPSSSPDPAGEISSVTATPLGMMIRGWAADIDSTSPISVAVSVDGRSFEVEAGRHDAARGRSDGFEVLWPLVPGAHAVCVTARNVGPGTDVELGCRPVLVSDAMIGLVGLQTL